MDLNHRPLPYQGSALTRLSYRPQKRREHYPTRPSPPDAVSRTVDDVLGTGGFDLLTTLEFSRVIGLATVIASVEIVLVSLLATLFAFLYNVSVGLTGGVEVILSDD